MSRIYQMIRIKVTTPFPKWPLLRQTPQGRGIWNRCEFHVDQPVESCDYWFVYEGLPAPESCRVPKGNVVFITGEPPSVRGYEPAFLSQFARVVSSHPAILSDHPGAIRSHQALPWHAGVKRGTHNEARLGFEDFERLSVPSGSLQKTRAVSVICSDRALTPGHRQRIDFVRVLKNHFGEKLEWFGRGFREIEDKWDALAPFRFHLALENSSHPDYWTEKLADCFLAECFPLYFGCPNLGEYFPSDSFAPIRIEDPMGAIALLERYLAENEASAPDPRARVRQEALLEAKRRVLTRYNLFPMMEQWGSHCSGGEPHSLTLFPESRFQPKPSLLRRIVGKARRLGVLP